MALFFLFQIVNLGQYLKFQIWIGLSLKFEHRKKLFCWIRLNFDSTIIIYWFWTKASDWHQMIQVGSNPIRAGFRTISRNFNRRRDANIHFCGIRLIALPLTLNCAAMSILFMKVHSIIKDWSTIKTLDFK